MNDKQKPGRMKSSMMIEEEPSNPMYDFFHPDESKEPGIGTSSKTTRSTRARSSGTGPGQPSNP